MLKRLVSLSCCAVCLMLSGSLGGCSSYCSFDVRHPLTVELVDHGEVASLLLVRVDRLHTNFFGGWVSTYDVMYSRAEIEDLAERTGEHPQSAPCRCIDQSVIARSGGVKGTRLLPETARWSRLERVGERNYVLLGLNPLQVGVASANQELPERDYSEADAKNENSLKPSCVSPRDPWGNRLILVCDESRRLLVDQVLTWNEAAYSFRVEEFTPPVSIDQIVSTWRRE